MTAIPILLRKFDQMNITILIKVILAVLETFAFFALGALGYERNMFTRESLPGFSRFAINVLTPLLIFANVAGKFTREDLITAWIYPVLGFAMIALHAGFGYILLPFLRNRTPERKATFMHMLAVNNFIFLPLIIVSYLWPGKTVAALLLCSVGSTFAQWTIGLAVMASGNNGKLWKSLITPNSIAVVVSIIYLLLPWKLPADVMNFFIKSGDLAIPLTLVLIGASIWSSRGCWWDGIGDMLYTTFARVVIIPVLTLLLLRFIPLPEITRNIALVLAVMPASSGSVLIVREYGGDVDFAGQLILSTTLFGLITMPILLAIVL